VVGVVYKSLAIGNVSAHDSRGAGANVLAEAFATINKEAAGGCGGRDSLWGLKGISVLSYYSKARFRQFEKVHCCHWVACTAGWNKEKERLRSCRITDPLIASPSCPRVT
jgi:hypothetical protein